MNLVMLFLVLQLLNVIIQTVKSIATIKCGKTGAALVNGAAYGLYTVVLVYTNADFSLWIKVLITFVTNLVGVYIVKMVEEKIKKDKKWKINFYLKSKDFLEVKDKLISFKYTTLKVDNENMYIQFYTDTQKETAELNEIFKGLDVKKFATANIWYE